MQHPHGIIGVGQGSIMPDDKWEKYQNLVLTELKRCHVMQEKSDEKIRQLQIDLAKLQVKASLFGAIAGAVSWLLHYLVK